MTHATHFDDHPDAVARRAMLIAATDHRSRRDSESAVELVSRNSAAELNISELSDEMRARICVVN